MNSAHRTSYAAKWTTALGVVLAAVLLAGCAHSAAGAIGADEAALEMSESAPVVERAGLKVHYVATVASNAYLLETPAGLVLVDTGLPGAADAIEARMAALGYGTLCLIYVTHAHLDHYGAAAELRRRTGAPVAIHAGDAAAMQNGATKLGQVRDWEWTEVPLPVVEQFLEVEPVEPDRLLRDGERIGACGLDATVIHTPGHTPGSSVLVVDGGYAFVGDLLSTTGDPHVQRFYAHDWDQLAASYAKVRDLRPSMVFPGHGPALVRGTLLADLAPEVTE